MPGQLRHRHAADADRGVVDNGNLAVDSLEYHEMIEIPVQYAGRPQLGEFFKLQPERPRGQADLLGDAHDIFQCGALERHSETAAQTWQVSGIPEILGDHDEAGQTAFRRFGLQHHRQPASPAEVEALENAHGDLPVSVNRGSNIHSIRRRESVITSASSCMPACSGAGSPYVVAVWWSSLMLIRNSDSAGV